LGLGEDVGLRADFRHHVAGFTLFEKVFSAYEECAKTTTWLPSHRHYDERRMR
jgi:hypothetical protein